MKGKFKLLFLICLFSNTVFSQKKALPLDKWQYIQADSSRAMWGNYDQPEWLRYYGLDFMDINKDGYKDIVSGRYFYMNPGKKMEGIWQRFDLGLNVDACMMVDIDGDEFADVIGLSKYHLARSRQLLG
jgi:hypothetical protein